MPGGTRLSTEPLGRRLRDRPAEPFYKERFQRATLYDHICHDCGELIPIGTIYRVVCWKKKWFSWKKIHDLC